MKSLLASLFLFLSFPVYAQEISSACTHWVSFLKPICQEIRQTWIQGENELYFSGYAWHNRYLYTREKINHYNEKAWGSGLGKGLFDEKGNWHGLYAIAFLDSHSQVEPTVGYAYLKVFAIDAHLKTGVGYSVLITSRADINQRIPFPGAVPWVSVFLKKFTLAAAYIPGNATNGNVLFVLSKYTF